MIGIDRQDTRLDARHDRPGIAIDLSDPRLADINGDAAKTVAALACGLGCDERFCHGAGVLRQNAVALKDRGYEILRLCD